MSSQSLVETVVGALMSTLVVIAAVILSGLFLGFPLKWCWNFVVPYVTNGVVPEIGFWHALAMWMLSSMLVKSTMSTKSR